MPNDNTSAAAGPAWPMALAAATVAGTLLTACMTPFVALGVMAAATMPRGRAALTVGGVWLANQALGFTVLGYPHTPSTFAWGGALGVAGLAAMLAASLLVGRGGVSALRLVTAFVAGFAVYEGLLFAFALAAGGLETFAPPIVARIAANEGVWLAGLAAVHLLLTWRAPRLFGAAPALRLA